MSLLSRRVLTFCSLFYAASFVSWVGAQTSNESLLSFQVSSGGNDNYFLRDSVTSAQLLLTSANNTSTDVRRFVMALPAGNSGALVYFLPLPNPGGSSNVTQNTTSTGNTTTAGNLTFAFSLVNGTFTSTTDDFNNTGAQAEISFTGNATLGVTIIGAVRAMRGTSFA